MPGADCSIFDAIQVEKMLELVFLLYGKGKMNYPAKRVESRRNK